MTHCDNMSQSTLPMFCRYDLDQKKGYEKNIKT